MLDRLTALEVFAKVAAMGSLSAAGRDLGMSQTMVTKHLAALETRLGVKLFHRTTRHLSITEAGRNYLETSERILADVEAADAAVAADRVEPRGLLRLNVPVAFGTRQIAPLLCEFTRRNPLVTVELGLNDRQVDLADEGWDLAIRIGILGDSSLIARRIASCKTIVCAAPSYLAARGTPRTLASLAEHNCLGYTLSSLTGVGPMGVRGKGGYRYRRFRKPSVQQRRSVASRGNRRSGSRLRADVYRCRRSARGNAGRVVAGSADDRVRRHLCGLSAGSSSGRKSARVHRFYRQPFCAGAALGQKARNLNFSYWHFASFGAPQHTWSILGHSGHRANRPAHYRHS